VTSSIFVKQEINNCEQGVGDWEHKLLGRERAVDVNGEKRNVGKRRNERDITVTEEAGVGKET
jgi:hypothetical protein